MARAGVAVVAHRTILLMAGVVALLGGSVGQALLPGARPSVGTRGDARPVIVCLGDSLTAGDAAPADQSYPAWLQRRLTVAGYHYRVVNAGVSGDTVAGGMARVPGDILPLHPAIVIVALGSNDPGRTPAGTWPRQLSALVARLQASGARVILGGLDQPGLGGAYRAVAARAHVPLVWFTAGLWSSPGLWGDRHHPNGAGYRVVMESFLPALLPLLRHPAPAAGAPRAR